MCVCVCARADEITFHVCLWQPAIVPTKNIRQIEAFGCVDFAKNLRSKVIARNTFQDAFVETEQTGG